ncbi:unnamed protein product [Peronospora belbahrii]|nr:unnamed protein product [Peronospora belbahrii]
MVEATESLEQPHRDGKKRLSIKERRDIKKGKVPVTKGSIDDQSIEEGNRTEGKHVDVKKDKEVTQMLQQKKNVRGKMGKMKKMKKKYIDQDDEDRRLRMEALGHVVEVGQADRENELTAQSKDENDERRTVAIDVKADVSEEYIRQQREKKEKYLEEQEDEAQGVDFFDAFVGEPLPNDIVQFAMPMCAPYASLTKYKYKVKLTPGSQKKGKAAKQAMEYFFASNLKDEKDVIKMKRHGDEDEDKIQPDVNPITVQRELLRCIEENEVVSCMVGPVKISGQALHAFDAGGKKGKRSCNKPKRKKK